MRLNRVVKKCSPINRHGHTAANKKTFSFDHMKDAEFPELKTSHTKLAGPSTMDYKSKFAEMDAASKEVSSLRQWGTTKYYKDNSNEIITEQHDVPLKVVVPKPHYSTVGAQKMVERWDKYTEQYIELHGNDAYHHYHSFPNYDYEYFDRLDEKYESEQKQDDDDALNEYFEPDEYLEDSREYDRRIS
jgi:hypothetical protein